MIAASAAVNAYQAAQAVQPQVQPLSTQAKAAAATAALTPQQQEALKKLHQAATQFEGVFMQMVMSAMRETVPTDSIFGTDDASGQTWQSMLDDEYSQGMARNGGVGLAAQLERQMRSAVLSNAAHESQVQVNGRISP
jgi:peptidoglycan hydrolase FlgJ